MFYIDEYLTAPPPIDQLVVLADGIDREIAANDGVCYLYIRHLAEMIQESYRSIPAVQAHLDMCSIVSKKQRWDDIVQTRGYYVAATFVCEDGQRGIAIKKGGIDDRTFTKARLDAVNLYKIWLQEAINEQLVR